MQLIFYITNFIDAVEVYILDSKLFIKSSQLRYLAISCQIYFMTDKIRYNIF